MTAPFVISTAVYVVALLLVVKSQRHRVAGLHDIIAGQQRDIARLMRLTDVLGDRTAALPCDVCGRPMASDGEHDVGAVVRSGPNGQTLIAHTFCAPPLPDEVERVIERPS